MPSQKLNGNLEREDFDEISERINDMVESDTAYEKECIFLEEGLLYYENSEEGEEGEQDDQLYYSDFGGLGNMINTMNKAWTPINREGMQTYNLGQSNF